MASGGTGTSGGVGSSGWWTTSTASSVSRRRDDAGQTVVFAGSVLTAAFAVALLFALGLESPHSTYVFVLFAVACVVGIAEGLPKLMVLAYEKAATSSQKGL
ncbi:hypothetical protein DFJ73DRAFT_863274 [Zopfochytrium polystomum]|nr:hypothetical protein DFJ73DRAFT_863274 [Zopfochytrium polystomum]